MNEEMRENVKIGLLGLIAVVMVINTFTGNGSDTSPMPASKATMAQTNNAPGNNNLTPNVTSQPNSPQTPQQQQPVQPKKPAGPTTSIAFEQEAHDFGTIKQDSENEHVFTFTNTGENPLIIENAKGSCGCTVPEYPKEPIAPGKTGEIKVVYKPGKQKGNQMKTVTLTANTEPSTQQLQIKANVEEEG